MKNKIVDLTHLVNGDMTVYPDTIKPGFELYNTIEKDGFAELKLTFCTHTGTHIDAPCHILENRKSLDGFPIDKFIGKAFVIPCLDGKDISLEYLQPLIKKISEVEFLLFYTGWQFKWNSKEYFENFPVLKEDAAEWLTLFKLKGIGFDVISADKVEMIGKESTIALPNHHTLLGNEILIIENLTNLDLLPDSVFTFQCMPLKIENADGSPVRAFAIIE
jgi:arylformamidase